MGKHNGKPPAGPTNWRPLPEIQLREPLKHTPGYYTRLWRRLQRMGIGGQYYLMQRLLRYDPAIARTVGFVQWGIEFYKHLRPQAEQGPSGETIYRLTPEKEVKHDQPSD